MPKCSWFLWIVASSVKYTSSIFPYYNVLTLFVLVFVGQKFGISFPSLNTIFQRYFPFSYFVYIKIRGRLAWYYMPWLKLKLSGPASSPPISTPAGLPENIWAVREKAWRAVVDDTKSLSNCPHPGSPPTYFQSPVAQPDGRRGPRKRDVLRMLLEDYLRCSGGLAKQATGRKPVVCALCTHRPGGASQPIYVLSRYRDWLQRSAS
jgi:hypothetical protein